MHGHCAGTSAENVWGRKRGTEKGEIRIDGENYMNFVGE
jgi:hypothetical protein